MAATRAASGSLGDAAVSGVRPRTATLFACVTTLSNTLLGVSVVGVAGGFARAGFAVGTFYLILFACLAGSGLHLLARSSMTVSAAAKRLEDAREEGKEGEGGAGKGGGRYPPPSSFRAVALAGAPRWAFLIDVAVALKCFGVATSYLVVVGDLMPTVMADIIGESPPDSFVLDRRFWVTVAICLATPLAFSRTLGALKYTATLAIGLVVFLSGIVMSFWILPGLDACPNGVGNATTWSAGGAAVETPADDAIATGAGEGFESRGLLLFNSAAVAAGRMLSSHSIGEAVGGEEGMGSSEDANGFESGGGDYGFDGGEENGGCFEGSNAVGSVRKILQTLPIFVFCFTCHQNIFTICNEIVRPTPARVDTVIACSMLVGLSIYMSLSWGAYATFGIGVEGDLLETYPRTWLLTAARVCVSMLVISCYPLQAHPSRLCILSTWKACSSDMQEAYSGLATDDNADDDQGALECASAKTSSPSRSRDSNTSLPADNSLGTITDGRGGSTPKLSEQEQRGRRRLVSRGSRDGARPGDAREGPPDDRETQRGAAEPEGLLSGADPAQQSDPLLQSGGDVSTIADFAVSNTEVGFKERGGGLRPRDTSSDAADVESADQSFPKRAATFGAVQQAGEQEAEGFWTSSEGIRHLVVTGAFLGLSYTIAMAVNDLGVILEVVGATGSTTVAFVLPGLLYLKVHPEPHPKRSLAALQLAAGLLIIPVALTFIALGDSVEGRR